MKTMKEAIGELPPEKCVSAWKRIKSEERLLKRNGRQAYLFPGMRYYPLPSQQSGDAAALERLLCNAKPPRWVLALPEWAAWKAEPENTRAYVALFCAMNHLTQ